MSDAILKMQDISKSYGGIKALDKVNLELNKGEILCLVGENGAGKSTLIKILSGIICPDEGDIFLNGEEIQLKDPRTAHEYGISTVYQELEQFPHLTVMENIYMGRHPEKLGFVDFKELKRKTIELMDKLNIHFNPDSYIKNLSLAQRQLVEIIKAISFNSKIVIFDEPTSSLTDNETEILFKIILNLKENGISIIYISHRLKDVFTIGDRVVVLKDGKNSGEGMVKELTEDQIITMMVGRNLENQFPKRKPKIGDEILRVENIENEHVKNVSFSVRKGEIVGFGGLVGAGRTELARAIIGLDKCSGNIYLNGKSVKNKTPEHAIKNKFAMVPEDRKEEGLVVILSVLRNIEMSSLKNLSKFGFMNTKLEVNCALQYIRQLRIKTPNYNYPVNSLSGGNQQKVVVAKCLATKPDILILDEPTRGIDVGSKAEIYEIMNELANEGVAIIMISSELPELLNMSDRIIVMREGKYIGELSAEDATEEAVMKLAMKEEIA